MLITLALAVQAFIGLVHKFSTKVINRVWITFCNVDNGGYIFANSKICPTAAHHTNGSARGEITPVAFSLKPEAQRKAHKMKHE